jgi:hypothetical protein
MNNIGDLDLDLIETEDIEEKKHLFIVKREYENGYVSKHNVDIRLCECDCFLYYLFCRPCPHIFSAIQQNFKDIEEIINDSILLLNFNYCLFFNKELYLEMKNSAIPKKFIPITNILNEYPERTTKLGKNLSNEKNDTDCNDILGITIENTLLYCKIKFKNWSGWVRYSIYNEKKEFQIKKFLNIFEIFLKDRIDPNNPIKKKVMQIVITEINEYQYFYNKGKFSKNKYASNEPEVITNVSNCFIIEFIKKVKILMENIGIEKKNK